MGDPRPAHDTPDAEGAAREPWSKARWRVPPGDRAEFVYRLENLLAVYNRADDPTRPLVCVDERALPDGANCFLAFAPRLGWRRGAIDERGARGWARFMRALVDDHFPDAERIVVVCDRRVIHSAASLYRTFPPDEAWRIREKLELHFAPKQGARLNLAEWELAVLTLRCLARRFPDPESLAAAVAAWADERNAAHVAVDWRFTIDDARVKLAYLYPVLAAEQ